jgi:hypothetical protein
MLALFDTGPSTAHMTEIQAPSYMVEPTVVFQTIG